MESIRPSVGADRVVRRGQIFGDDALAALAEVLGIAKPGGHLAISNWAEAIATT